LIIEETAMDKLICDHCGFEITDKEEIFRVLDGMEAWQNAVIARGETPRGVYPCKFYFQCKGEMILVKKKEKQNKWF
jgi:hypothetical protein